MSYTSIITESLIEPGEIVGDYAILGNVALGLFGALYVVRDGRSGSKHLLQVLPDALAKSPRPTESLQEVVSTLSELSIPSLLTPDLVEELGDSVCLRYPFVDGETLARYMEDPAHWEGLPEAKVTHILGEISKACAAANAVDMPHLALSSEHVILGSDGAVKVYGFGVFGAIHRRRWELFVSTAINPLAGEKDVRFLTSLDTISPEVRNNEQGDERSDIYGFGIVAYWLLAGEKPGRELMPVLPARLKVAKGWSLVIERCAESRPKDRYTHFAALQSDIRRVDELTPENLGQKVQEPGRVARNVDRVPLPAMVERRLTNPQQRILRLVMLGLLGIVSVGLGGYFMRIVLIDAEPVAIVDVRAGTVERANTILRIEPQRARVDVETLSESPPVFVSDGLALLRLPAGDHRLRVSAPGFRQTHIEISPGRTALEKAVLLTESFGHLRLRGPPGAYLFALPQREEGSPVYVGTISPGGSLDVPDRLLAVIHRLEVRAPGYISRRFEAVRLIEGEVLELEAELVRVPAILTIATDEDGIPVRIDGEPVGVTPFVADYLPSGVPIRVEVGGDIHERQAREIVLEAGGRERIDFGTLGVREGILRVEVLFEGHPPSPVDELRIRINGEEQEPSSRLETVRPVGRHTVQVDHPDYFSAEQILVIDEGAESTATFSLVGRPARLRLETSGESFRLLLDGEPAEPGNGYLELPASEQTVVTFIVPDHLAVQRTFRPRPNETVVWRPELRPLPGPVAGQAFTVPHLNMGLSWIPAGVFTMGSPRAEPERLPTEDIQTSVRLTRGFWMAQTETTQAAFRAIMGTNPSRFPGADRPVESVTRSEAMLFAERLTAFERQRGRLPRGYVYRLPTEAEWEYAARAGSLTAFPWGDTAGPTDGNFSGQYPRDFRGGMREFQQREEFGTVPVSRFAPNAWGLYDTAGNVREWTLDAFHDRLPGRDQVDFVRWDGGRGYVVRGGSWEDFAHRARTAARERANPELRHPGTGFRVVLAPELSR
ncbi:MAG: SUMF1/EgtB/PvdO family nonheme iron enzyme [Opitutales bacterium]|nr:SUMF1/EgtB/PvdO family nonheme iron enzyme [Opitutales bacterium]